MAKARPTFDALVRSVGPLSVTGLASAESPPVSRASILAALALVGGFPGGAARVARVATRVERLVELSRPPGVRPDGLEMADRDADKKRVTLPDDATSNAVFQRVAERLRRDQGPPSVVLPANKDDFPKLLALDQHVWIRLARAHYGKDDGEPVLAALEAVRAARARGTLVVPMTATNVAEVAEPADEARRLRLATFMVELSGNFSILHPTVVKGMEAERAIRQDVLGETPPPIRPLLVRWGVNAAAIGHDPSVPTGEAFTDAVINQALNEPEFSITMLVHAINRSTIDQLRELDLDGVGRIDRIRAIDGQLPPAQRRPGEMFEVLTRGTYAAQVQSALDRAAIPQAVFLEWIRDEQRLLHLTSDMPGIDVQTTLAHARDRNPNERTHQNDFKDMSFLDQAIPYGNIVVTENLWAALANGSELPARYGTNVIASLRDIPGALRAAGCL